MNPLNKQKRDTDQGQARESAGSGSLKITESGQGITFRIKVQPGAARNEITGQMDGILKLRVSAPPVDGKANAACVRFLAGLLVVRATSIDIKSGASARTKTITVRGITAEYARAHLDPAARH